MNRSVVKLTYTLLVRYIPFPETDILITLIMYSCSITTLETILTSCHLPFVSPFMWLND